MSEFVGMNICTLCASELFYIIAKKNKIFFKGVKVLVGKELAG